MFQDIQLYMGDRNPRRSSKGTEPPDDLDILAVGVIYKAHIFEVLRDELYLQLCKQTNKTKEVDSMRRGWELMAICLNFIPPTPSLKPLLQEHFTEKTLDKETIFQTPVEGYGTLGWHLNKYANKCLRRMSAPPKPWQQPHKADIKISKLNIVFPSKFGETLEETMEKQRKKHPNEKLPWVLTALSEKIVELKGKETEGIFRVAADHEDVCRNQMFVDQQQMHEIKDCHTAATLLKQWLRELQEPLIPGALTFSLLQKS